MMRIYQQAAGVQRERSRWFEIRCGQKIRRAIRVFVGFAFLTSFATAQSTSFAQWQRY